MVWLDYKFLQEEGHAVPKGLQYCASFVGGGKSLAEVFIRNKDAIETALDWQEVLSFKNTELRFELHKSNISQWVPDIKVIRKE